MMISKESVKSLGSTLFTLTSEQLKINNDFVNRHKEEVTATIVSSILREVLETARIMNSNLENREEGLIKLESILTSLGPNCSHFSIHRKLSTDFFVELVKIVSEETQAFLMYHPLNTESLRTLINSLSDLYEGRIAENKKEKGIYYTPPLLAQHMAKQATDLLLEEHSGLTSEISMLDPACGTGVFLREFVIHFTRKTNQQLSDVITNQIYGNDIDLGALIVAKASLVLLLFSNSQPSLEDVCGHLQRLKLTQSDFLSWGFGPGNIQPTKAAFDILLSNPPYGSVRQAVKSGNYAYLKQYATHSGYNDLSSYFFEQGVKYLKHGGILSLLTPKYYLQNTYSNQIRHFIANYLTIFEIMDLSDVNVFDVGIHTAVLTAKVSESIVYAPDNLIRYVNACGGTHTLHDFLLSLDSTKITSKEYFISQTHLGADPWILVDTQTAQVMEKMNQDSCSAKLASVCHIKKGTSTGKNQVFIISEETRQKYAIESKWLKRYVRNSDVHRYALKYRNLWLITVNNPQNLHQKSNLLYYLSLHQSDLEMRNEVRQGLYHWTRLERPRKPDYYEGVVKLITPFRATRNTFAIDEVGHYGASDTYHLTLRPEYEWLDVNYLAGLLNSSLLDWYYAHVGKSKGKVREYFVKPLANIPVRIPNIDNALEAKRYNQVIKLTKKIVEALRKGKKEHIIQNMENDIDSLVLDIYGLSKDDFAAVQV